MARRVSVTFGSDSHKPERVGEHWDTVVDMLRCIGYKEMKMYRNMKPFSILI
jgi:histidinol-phosphatase (PHP family)